MARNLFQATGLPTTNAGNVVEYVITYFVPGLHPLLQRYPRVIRLLGFLLALWYCAPLSLIQSLWTRFSSFIISTVEVSVEEDLFHHLTTWIAEQNTLRPNKTLYAMSNRLPETPSRRPGNADPEAANRKQVQDRVKYEQSQGLQIFVYKKRIFFLTRALAEGHTYYVNRVRRLETLKVSCFGRSTAPIQSLIDQVYRTNREKEKFMTIIRRPYSGAGGRVSFNWSRLTSKLPRDLDTVILDSAQKAAVLDDITEYMTETTRTFYADHGIPYRRGFMFYGPPGTGKTSFCLALASHFHLDVYVLTLLDHNIQDSDLMSLMNQLPSPSILLLEDIDTAGLSRRQQFVDTTDTTDDGTNNTENVAMTANPEKSQLPDVEDSEDDKANKPSTRVSLSGLLNAIDGVAAPEGHILIMTTNRPYELDDALARAGRVSVTVPFTNATRQQAEELFVRMYVDTRGQKADDSLQPTNTQEEEDSATRQLAQEFAGHIPDGQFSPADLQDYLLVHKRNAQRAVDQVGKWVNDKQSERKRRTEAKLARKRRVTTKV